jgi:integrase
MKGHIKKRGKTSWTLIFDLGPDPKTGRRRQRWETIPDCGKRAAQRILNSRLANIEEGTYTAPSDILVEEFLSRWLEAWAKQHTSPRTFERYEEIVQKHLSPALGKVELVKLSALEIQAYYSQARQTGRRKGGALSARTVLHHHRILRQALSRAVKWDLLTRNPTDKVEPPKAPRLEMRALNEKQSLALIALVEDNRILALPVTLAITTGLRRGEILGLKWSDINLDTAMMSICRTLEESKARLEFKQPKTERSRRAVALPAIAVLALRKHHAEQARLRLKLGVRYNADDLVCCRIDGRPVHPHTVTQEFINVIRDAKLPHVRFHDLRHTHATILLARRASENRFGAARPFDHRHYTRHLFSRIAGDAGKGSRGN